MKRFARMRTGTRAVTRAVAVVATALAVPLLTPSPAAACDVGVGYRPEISFGRGGLAGGTCETGTSLAGAAVLAVLALAALAAFAVARYRRGQAAAAALAGPGQAADPDAALTRYLDSVGLSRSPSSGGGPPA